MLHLLKTLYRACTYTVPAKLMNPSQCILLAITCFQADFNVIDDYHCEALLSNCT